MEQHLKKQMEVLLLLLNIPRGRLMQTQDKNSEVVTEDFALFYYIELYHGHGSINVLEK